VDKLNNYRGLKQCNYVQWCGCVSTVGEELLPPFSGRK